VAAPFEDGGRLELTRFQAIEALPNARPDEWTRATVLLKLGQYRLEGQMVGQETLRAVRSDAADPRKSLCDLAAQLLQLIL
jgi:hypothetical protein